jgi:sugar/nucleoside kinase (ribokinase family)
LLQLSLLVTLEEGAMRREKTWDVVVVGDFFIDIIMSGFYTLPKLGEEGFAQTMRTEIGGGAAITSSGLARLGLKVAVLGVVGHEDGIWIVKRLMNAGVNASALEIHESEPSGHTVSVSTPEDRAFFTYYGANEQLTRLIKEKDARKLMASARHVHFACGPDPVLDAGLFRELKRHDCNVSIDVGWHEMWLTDPASYDLLRAADMFFPNEREAELMTGCSDPRDMLRTLGEKGIPRVALKLGANGAMLDWEGEIHTAPPYPVDPLDTTGAGDSFDAGFIYGWVCGEPPSDCLQIGAVCGALSTRGLGGIATFPTKNELQEALSLVRS